jgi:hypothetical protein
MPINIDWLGDGWTYYPDDERKHMDSKKPKAPKTKPGWYPQITDIGVVDLPVDKRERMMLMAAAAGSLRMMILPALMGRMLIDAIRSGGVPKPLFDDLVSLVEGAEDTLTLNEAMRRRDLN